MENLDKNEEYTTLKLLVLLAIHLIIVLAIGCCGIITLAIGFKYQIYGTIITGFIVIAYSIWKLFQIKYIRDKLRKYE